MSLEKLPIEIICMIFQFVGTRHLRQSLLVCKWWYNLAEPIALEDLVLRVDALMKIPEEAHQRLVDYVQHLSIELYGLDDRLAKRGKKTSTEKAVTRRQWSESLSDHLDKLSVLLPRCTHLESFALWLRSEFDPEQPLAPRHDYLSLWSETPLVDALQASNLSRLVIDTCGSDLRSHICPGVALKIPSLRSVRLRMQKICPAILNLPSAQDDCSTRSDKSKPEKQRDPTSFPKIESILINLSLKEEDRFSAGYSRHCTESRRGWDLYDDMVAAATDLAKRFPTLKVLRILCHKHPSLEMVTRDCISNSKMILADDGDWDWGDDGWADPDDEEISNQGFSSTDSDSDDD